MNEKSPLGLFYRKVFLAAWIDEISKFHLVKDIISSLQDTGKSISRDIVKAMITMANNHPDYSQQLSHDVWNGTESVTTMQVVEDDKNLVMSSNNLYYQDICDALNNTQLKLPYAILAGETKFIASETMYNYRQGTPRNVNKINKSWRRKRLLRSMVKQSFSRTRFLNYGRVNNKARYNCKPGFL